MKVWRHLPIVVTEVAEIKLDGVWYLSICEYVCTKDVKTIWNRSKWLVSIWVVFSVVRASTTYCCEDGDRVVALRFRAYQWLGKGYVFLCSTTTVYGDAGCWRMLSHCKVKVVSNLVSYSVKDQSCAFVAGWRPQRTRNLHYGGVHELPLHVLSLFSDTHYLENEWTQ